MNLFIKQKKSEKEERIERKEILQREHALVAAVEQIKRIAIILGMSVGDEERGSSRNAFRKRQYDDGDDWYKMFKNELLHKRRARTKQLELMREELELSRERWEKVKKDRELQRDQTRKQLDMLVTLSLSLK